MVLLEVKNLRTYVESARGVVRCVEDANFSISAGETLGLMGESGSGKTMTARSIIGIVDSFPGVISGQIHFAPDGLDGPTNLTAALDSTVLIEGSLNGQPPVFKKERQWQRETESRYRDIRGKRISVIFQDPQASLNPYWTVGQQLAEAIQIKGGDPKEVGQRVDWWLEQVYLHPSKASAYPHELSGGMCQRVMIAIALASEPDLIIADEPTTGLDVTTQACITQLFKDLQAKLGFSMLLISHDVGLISHLAHRVAVMYCGRIVEQGPRDKILGSPLLRREEVLDWPGFLGQLREPAGPYLDVLCPLLDEDIQQWLRKGSSVIGADGFFEGCQRLIEALHKLMRRADLVKEQDFSGVIYPKEIGVLLDQEPPRWSPVEVECLNRLLLQAECGSTIAPSILIVLAMRRHPYTKALLGALPELGAQEPGRRTDTIEHDVPDLVDPPPGCVFHPRCPVYKKDKRELSQCAQELPPRRHVHFDHWLHCWAPGRPQPTDREGTAAVSGEKEPKEPSEQTVLVRLDGITKEYLNRERSTLRQRLNSWARRRIRGDKKEEREHTHRVLNAVSLDVYKGETLGLVGESGCGKTTLGRALLRLIDINQGGIEYAGRFLHGLSRNQLRGLRRQMQMIFQDPYSALNNKMTVEEIVGEALSLTTDKRPLAQRLNDVMQQVNFPIERLREKPSVLSGGERRRVGIARTLAVAPDFIVADEPVAALDLSIKGQILALLQRLKEERALTFLFISHDIGTIRQVSDRIAVMYLGKIVELGGNGTMQSSYCLHPYTYELLQAADYMAHSGIDSGSLRQVVVRGVGEIPDTVPKGCPYHPRCSLFKAKGEPTDCKEQEPVLRLHDHRGAAHQVACHYPGEILEKVPQLL